jgi:hypothetical protein
VILHQSVGHFILLGVSIFDVADGVFHLLNITRHTRIAFASNPDRPGDRDVVADFFLPRAADLGKVIRKNESGAGPVRPVDHSNF